MMICMDFEEQDSGMLTTYCHEPGRASAPNWPTPASGPTFGSDKEVPDDETETCPGLPHESLKNLKLIMLFRANLRKL
jgi:hypothetical protein